MARRLNMIFLVVIAISALLLQSTTAQTTHVVGDALNWVVPPNGAVAYTTWAANRTFTVGDILVFNFASGRHDVAEVTKANFDACNTNSPISLTSNSPANITLTAAGEHHYICTFSGHCSGGQKLAINVSTASSSPSPQPSSPSPIPVPAPAPQPIILAPVPVLSPVPVLAPAPSISAPTPAMSPSPTATPPSTTATPPSTSATPPSTPTTPSSPSPTSVATPPPPPSPNSATSLGVAGLSATFLSIVVAFLY